MFFFYPVSVSSVSDLGVHGVLGLHGLAAGGLVISQRDKNPW